MKWRIQYVLYIYFIHWFMFIVFLSLLFTVYWKKGLKFENSIWRKMQSNLQIIYNPLLSIYSREILIWYSILKINPILQFNCNNSYIFHVQDICCFKEFKIRIQKTNICNLEARGESRTIVNFKCGSCGRIGYDCDLLIIQWDGIKNRLSYTIRSLHSCKLGNSWVNHRHKEPGFLYDPKS